MHKNTPKSRPAETITYQGKTMTYSQWSRHLEEMEGLIINPGALRNRIKSGWSKKKALTTPQPHRNPRL